MVRCPLCEHEVLGDACDVCGRALRGGVVVAGTVTPLEGLEGTAYALLGDAAPAVVPLAELEPTGTGLAPPFAGPPEPWVEATLQAAVAVTVEPLEVERTTGDGARSPQPALRACRYCGELVPEGEAFCLRCAMHAVPSSPAGRAGEQRQVTVRCRECGTLAAGARCPACGERLPEPDVG